MIRTNCVSVTNKTVYEYHCMVANESNAIIEIPGAAALREPNHKKRNKYIAERFLCSAMSYVMTVLASNFINSIEEDLPNAKMTDGVTKSIKVLREANVELKMMLILPYLIFNHDDTTTFLVQNSIKITYNNNKQMFLLSYIDGIKDKGTWSLNTTPSKKLPPKGGLQIKSSHTLTAAGYKGRPFYFYMILLESELTKEKCPQGWILLKIEELGALPSTNLFNKEHGYVV